MRDHEGQVQILWARRPDGVEIGLRQFEGNHPCLRLRGSWCVLSRHEGLAPMARSGPLSEEEARAAARLLWEQE